MRTAIAIVLLAGCSLYTGNDHPNGSGSSAGAEDLYQLTVDHSVSAEGTIKGVDADQQGGLWIAYATEGNYQENQKPVVTLVHWDPATRQRLATFTYSDFWSEVSGLAIVQGRIWLNYEDIATKDAGIRVIDPASGSVLTTFGTSGVELAAMGSNRALVSAINQGVLELDTANGGVMRTFASPVVVDPGDMGGVSFTDTQQGIAWRPGEIWVANWYMPSAIFDEDGNVLGTINLAQLQSVGADPMHHLAFDRGKLLVGTAGQLTWYDVQ
jgi:hypothetical protein